MLVSELRVEISKYSQKELENIIVELYKRIPKAKKEEYNIDEHIKNINTIKEVKSKKTRFRRITKRN